jgi:hypothetical protein
MTTPDTTTPMPAWTVTAQQETTIINAAGNAVDVMHVTFQLPDGTQGSVNVPLSAYTAANVKKAIADKAATLDAVNNLTSE